MRSEGEAEVSDYGASEAGTADDGNGSGSDYVVDSQDEDDARRPKRRKVPVKPAVPAIDSAQTRKLRSRDPVEEGDGATGATAIQARNDGSGRTRVPPLAEEALYRSGQAAPGRGDSLRHTFPVQHPHHHPSQATGNGTGHNDSSSHTLSTHLHGLHPHAGPGPLTTLHHVPQHHHHQAEPNRQEAMHLTSLQQQAHTISTSGHQQAQPHAISQHRSSRAAAGTQEEPFVAAANGHASRGQEQGDQSDPEEGEGDEEYGEEQEEVIPERVMSNEEIMASTAAVNGMWQLTAVVECLTIFAPWMFSQGGLLWESQQRS